MKIKTIIEKLKHNFGLKLLSVGLAALLWLVVINSQDPVETRTFDDISVTIMNEDALTAKDKIPEIVEGDEVSVVVQARRSVCEKLTKEDITAVADFEKISVTDAVPIDVSIDSYYANDVEIIRGMNQVMKLRLEDSITKDFRVKISTTGQTKEGYVIGDMVASPNMISLTGSSTQISKVKEVVLVVDVEGLSKDSQATGVPVIYDMNGDVVHSSKVEMNAKEVAVTIPLLKTQTVKINVHPVGEPAVGHEVGSVSYQPEMVTVAGTISDLILLGSTLDAYCDITEQSGVVEENIEISSLWSEELESLRLVDEDMLAVTITVKPYEEKVFEMGPADIGMVGLSDNRTGTVLRISVRELHVIGKEESMQELTLEKLAPYIDLSGYDEPGTYTMAVCIEEPTGIIVEDILFATVEISVTPSIPEPTEAPEAPEASETPENGKETE